MGGSFEKKQKQGEENDESQSCDGKKNKSPCENLDNTANDEVSNLLPDPTDNDPCEDINKNPSHEKEDAKGESGSVSDAMPGNCKEKNDGSEK